MGAAALIPFEAQAMVRPLKRAHAHNDYEHARPLLDALDNGFCSVEADIYLVDGKLLVGHFLKDVKPERTLEALYLEPLKKRIEGNKGWVFEKNDGFTLLIDIKTDAVKTLDALTKVLEPFSGMLTRFGEDKTPRAVTAIISGERDRIWLEANARRLVAMDGRPADLGADTAPASLIPLVSDSWANHFKWKGEGVQPIVERMKLKDMAAMAHEQRRRLRFWATPESPAVWSALYDAGVDLIGTDDLPALSKFLQRA